MPVFLIMLGLALILTAVRGKEQDLIAILEDDFTKNDSFMGWLAAFGMIGFVGSISKNIRPMTDAFSALLLVVLLVANKGFFEQFQRQALE